MIEEVFERVKPLALEMTTLTPREVWLLTPGETVDMIEAGVRRERRVMERTAWAVAHLVNIHIPRGRPAITVRKLLGRPVSGEKTGLDSWKALDEG